DELQRIASENDQAPVIAVSDMPGGNQKYQSRQEEHKPGISKIDRAVGDLINLPSYRDGLRFGAHDYDYPGQLVAPEISKSEGCRTGGLRGHKTVFFVYTLPGVTSGRGRNGQVFCGLPTRAL